MKKNDILKFDNYSYIIKDIINYKNNIYAYLINNDKFMNDISIVKVIKNDNKIECKHIEDNEEFNYVLCRLYLDFKEDILDFFK